MAANSTSPHLYFNMVNPFSNLKTIIIFFVSKTLKFYTKGLKQHVILIKLHTGSTIADKFEVAAIIDQNRVTKNFKMMLFNCCVLMNVYLKKMVCHILYCQVAIMDLL